MGTEVTLPDEGEWGPAFAALPSDRQRLFVIALVNQGGKNASRAYLEAGYTVANRNVADVGAHRLSHDAAVQAAIREQSFKRMGAAGLAATSLLVDIITADEQSGVKISHKLKAASMIMNRTGLHETTEHVVTTERKLNDHEKVEKIIATAKALGLDPKTLLGQAGIVLDPVKTIDVTPNTPAEHIDGSAGLEDLLA